MTEPPEAMTRKARDLLAVLGHPGEPAGRGRAVRASLGVDYPGPADRPVLVSEGRRPARRRGVLLPRLAGTANPDVQLEVTWSNPPAVTPGTAAVRLDTQGRLVELQVVPPARPDGLPTAREPRGRGAAVRGFRADPARFTPTDPARTPPTACDAQAAWAGTWGDGSDTPVRVEAGAYRGKPVWFRVDGPTTGSEHPTDPTTAPPPVVMLFILAFTGLAGLLAWRNVRRGRGDRVTARRLGSVLGGWQGIREV
jgi:hypothetical protein